jgi:integrase
MGIPQPPRRPPHPTTRRADRYQAAGVASDTLTARGLPPLPNTTPHTLRRTYISIALLANNFDVLWVMHQVGHADSKMTLDVDAQLQQRVKRDHGHAFDHLVQQAREHFTSSAVEQPSPDENAPGAKRALTAA